ncbi:MAG: hypothetical protein ABIR27_09830 [Dokdonella sp.]
MAAALVCAGFVSSASVKADYYDLVNHAQISLSPDPALVNQESPATLHIMTRADVHGFIGMNEPVHVPNHQVVGQRLDLFFPTDCSFGCQNLPIGLVAHPFLLPPLSEGMHTVRILADSGPDVLAEFTIPVGGAPIGIPAAVQLPVAGGVALGLLGASLVLMAWVRARATKKAVEDISV